MLAERDAGPPDESPLGELVMRAMGAERAASDQLGDVGPLLADVPPAEDVFSNLASTGLLPIGKLPQLIDTATSEELVRARDDARMVIEDASAVAMALETVFGRNAFGLGFIRGVGQRRSVPLAALLIAASVGLRRAWSAAENNNFDALSAAFRAVSPKAKAHLRALRKPLPGLEPKQHKSPARPLARPAGTATGGNPDAVRQATARQRAGRGSPQRGSFG
jgi:hypothetical protein